MASRATESATCPDSTPPESLVPACMFAPDQGSADDPSGGEGFEDGEGTNGESVDHLDLSNKLVLVSPTGEQYDSLLRQLRERIEEGCGETIYVVGMGSDGGDYGLDEKDMEASVATVRSLCEQIEADLILLRERTESGGKIRDYLIRRRVGEQDFLEVRVAVVGNVDAGKSTLLGVLTHGELDNGRGFARQKLFRHKHEMESGRTSSVGNDILGFDQEGQVVNKPDSHGGGLDWTKICEKSSKVITFIDLAGHEKYLKTTVFGMTGHLPDFCMLMVGSNAGIVGMTKEHLGLALALNVPVFVVVTKIDMCPANILQETLKLLQRLLKSPGCRKIPVLVQNKDDVVVTASNFSSERVRDPSPEGCVRADVRVSSSPGQLCLLYRDEADLSYGLLHPPYLNATGPEADSLISSNMVPMFPAFKKVWSHFHTSVLLKYSQQLNGVNIISGPIFDVDFDGHVDPVTRSSGNGSTVPTHFFLIMTSCYNSSLSPVYCEGPLQAMSFIMPHTPDYTEFCAEESDFSWVEEWLKFHVARVRDIELLTGLSFYHDRISVEETIQLKTFLHNF
ncbi:GTP-binding protein 1 [Crenichthys baileyi]|uniref:GTP-binding protein 1 n=2 Tax=Goodeidae TaxID=28758 RepID=A0AAV9RDJ5_9TELE